MNRAVSTIINIGQRMFNRILPPKSRFSSTTPLRYVSNVITRTEIQCDLEKQKQLDKGTISSAYLTLLFRMNLLKIDQLKVYNELKSVGVITEAQIQEVYNEISGLQKEIRQAEKNVVVPPREEKATSDQFAQALRSQLFELQINEVHDEVVQGLEASAVQTVSPGVGRSQEKAMPELREYLQAERFRLRNIAKFKATPVRHPIEHPLTAENRDAALFWIETLLDQAEPVQYGSLVLLLKEQGAPESVLYGTYENKAEYLLDHVVELARVLDARGEENVQSQGLYFSKDGLLAKILEERSRYAQVTFAEYVEPIVVTNDEIGLNQVFTCGGNQYQIVQREGDYYLQRGQEDMREGRMIFESEPDSERLIRHADILNEKFYVIEESNAILMFSPQPNGLTFTIRDENTWATGS